MALLSKSGLVHGVSKKGGGYRLTKSPAEYTAGDILRVTEGTALAPVACLASGSEDCANAEHCRTLPLWRGLDKQVNDYLDSVTIADLAK